jgi:hypothetical protein
MAGPDIMNAFAIGNLEQHTTVNSKASALCNLLTPKTNSSEGMTNSESNLTVAHILTEQRSRACRRHPA